MAIAFGGGADGSILQAISSGISDFDTLSIAVSYIQLSGWELLQPLIADKVDHVRLVCTDQLGITDPSAVRAMQMAGLTVHAYTGAKVYHPKIFIASRKGQPDRWVLGSANISRSALQSSVEAVFQSHDDDGGALTWFNTLFAQDSEPFDEARLAALELAFAARIKGALAAVRARPLPLRVLRQDAAASETVEAAFASLPDIVVPLNADKAGNNVRTLRRIKEVLDDAGQLREKALSEFKLIGLALDGGYTPVGQSARGKELAEIAKLWMSWLKYATQQEVQAANPSGRLAQARIAFDTFWSFPAPVREYFLNHATAPAPDIRLHLQAIELLANTGKRMPNLTVEDIQTLSKMLTATAQLQPRVRTIIEDYLANKGTRGWSEPDRVLVLQAWHNA